MTANSRLMLMLKNKSKLATEQGNNDKYVWYAYFATKDQKKADKAQEDRQENRWYGYRGAAYD